MITVKGYHFSTDYQDNPIRIGYTDCLVESSTVTELKCRTQPRMEEQEGTDDFIVFLKTYEEAVCEVKPCQFQWVSTDLATVTGSSVDFDTSANDYFLTLSGTNFGATTSNT